jgi:2-(1,2-epoxy-1,2-dihydrophenyl)acetyl-CoA isomerase
MMARLAALPFPVVTAIQGPAGGAGIGLALCGDFALASTSAAFRAGYPALGVSSDFGVSFLLARLGGARLATDMLMTNRLVPAVEALTRGLVTSVHAPDALEPAARDLLSRLATGPTVAHAMTRAVVRLAGSADFVAHLGHEETAMLVTARTADAADGIAAFLGKRPAVFRGA